MKMFQVGLICVVFLATTLWAGERRTQEGTESMKIVAIHLKSPPYIELTCRHQKGRAVHWYLDPGEPNARWLRKKRGQKVKTFYVLRRDSAGRVTSIEHTPVP